VTGTAPVETKAELPVVPPETYVTCDHFNHAVPLATNQVINGDVAGKIRWSGSTVITDPAVSLELNNTTIRFKHNGADTLNLRSDTGVPGYQTTAAAAGVFARFRVLLNSKQDAPPDMYFGLNNADGWSAGQVNARAIYESTGTQYNNMTLYFGDVAVSVHQATGKAFTGVNGMTEEIWEAHAWCFYVRATTETQMLVEAWAQLPWFSEAIPGSGVWRRIGQAWVTKAVCGAKLYIAGVTNGANVRFEEMTLGTAGFDPADQSIIRSAYFRPTANGVDNNLQDVACAVAPSGRVWSLTFTGTSESATDRTCRMLYSDDLGLTWTAAPISGGHFFPQLTNEVAHGGAIVCDGSTILVFTGYGTGEGSSTLRPVMRASNDSGATWTDILTLDASTPAIINRKSIRIQAGTYAGRWMVPYAVNGKLRIAYSAVAYPDDVGAGDFANCDWSAYTYGTGIDAGEPVITEMANGLLYLVTRQAGVIKVGWSSDGGANWYPNLTAGVPSGTVNTLKAMDGTGGFSYMQSKDSANDVVWAHGAVWIIQTGIDTTGIRHDLIAWRSADNGKTYLPTKALIAGRNTCYSIHAYPYQIGLIACFNTGPSGDAIMVSPNFFVGLPGVRRFTDE
jgi:hypothetical protein